MGAGHNFQKFVTAILDLSNSKEWLEAKPEWELHAVYHDASLRACECGHEPINQICIIKNRDNGNEAEVGNVCVHNFMQLASRRIFAVLKRVRAEITKSLNPRSLELFARRGAISESEMAEYLAYWQKRSNMTDEQRSQKLEINRRVLEFWDQESARLAAAFRTNGLKPR
ncbi:hypothetical protein GGR88_002593 [Sphingomonas jejuensis]|uniref:Uncharacterized protein n=1 Tax=Sphingomonas jejuensis TaxID=904715 RepID=A0ABX0XQL8_9SPHN|nr:hypothetical protein [Sphingomonas jejuensis]NJC35079.1 hypothetical protein [Sphingomonas jejuensis]